MRAATFDFSPLYRSTVGFEHLAEMLDLSIRVEPMTKWPPYNIDKINEDTYRITMAVAGFSSDEIQVVQQGSTLFVAGDKHAEQEVAQVLHRGIATRAFKKSFNLADYMRVTEASLENGLLIIALVREIPEAVRPRRIAIGFAAPRRENIQGEEKAGEPPGRAA